MAGYGLGYDGWFGAGAVNCSGNHHHRRRGGSSRGNSSPRGITDPASGSIIRPESRTCNRSRMRPPSTSQTHITMLTCPILEMCVSLALSNWFVTNAELPRERSLV